MTGGARVTGYVVGALMVAGGLWLHAASGGGWPLAVLGLLVIAGIALEPRYRRGAAATQGAWEPTGERFADDETGELVEVWYDPASGLREYRPVGNKSDI